MHETGVSRMIRHMGHVARGGPTKRWEKHVQRCWTSEVASTAWHMRRCIEARAAHCVQVEADVATASATWVATRGYLCTDWRIVAEYRSQWEAFARDTQMQLTTAGTADAASMA